MDKQIITEHVRKQDCHLWIARIERHAPDMANGVLRAHHLFCIYRRMKLHLCIDISGLAVPLTRAKLARMHLHDFSHRNSRGIVYLAHVHADAHRIECVCVYRNHIAPVLYWQKKHEVPVWPGSSPGGMGALLEARMNAVIGPQYENKCP